MEVNPIPPANPIPSINVNPDEVKSKLESLSQRLLNKIKELEVQKNNLTGDSIKIQAQINELTQQVQLLTNEKAELLFQNQTQATELLQKQQELQEIRNDLEGLRILNNEKDNVLEQYALYKKYVEDFIDKINKEYPSDDNFQEAIEGGGHIRVRHLQAKSLLSHGKNLQKQMRQLTLKYTKMTKRIQQLSGGSKRLVRKVSSQKRKVMASRKSSAKASKKRSAKKSQKKNLSKKKSQSKKRRSLH